MKFQWNCPFKKEMWVREYNPREEAYGRSYDSEDANTLYELAEMSNNHCCAPDQNWANFRIKGRSIELRAPSRKEIQERGEKPYRRTVVIKSLAHQTMPDNLTDLTRLLEKKGFKKVGQAA